MEKHQELIWGKYARKSSEAEDRQAASIESQQKELNQIATRESIVIVPNLNFEEAHSAKRPGRPIFEKMVQQIERGKMNALLAWSPNRISRNAVDTGRIIDLMDRGLLLVVQTPSQTFRNTPTDKFMLTLFCGQGKLENDNKGVDVARGLRHKASTGEYPAPAPLGYKNEPTGESGKKKMLVDDKRFPIIRKMWDYMLTGKYSVAAIVRMANEDWGLRTPIRKNGTGNKKITKSLAYYIFSRTFYYGEYEYPVGSGNWHQGNHKPMVTRDEYDRVQVLLGRKGRPRPHKREFTYRDGRIICGECNGSVTAEIKRHCVCSKCWHKFSCINKTACTECGTDIGRMKNPIIRDYRLYHCSKRVNPKCSQPSIGEDELENQVRAELLKFEVKEGFTAWALDVLRSQNVVESTNRNAILKAQQKEYDAVLARIDNLTDMRANEEISAEEFRRKREKAFEEKKKLFKELQNTDKRVENWLEVAERGFDFAATARARFEDDVSEDLAYRKEVFATFGSNYILKDKKVTVKADNLLFAIKNVKDAVEAAGVTFEPGKDGSTPSPFMPSGEVLSNVLPDLDSNQDTLLQRE